MPATTFSTKVREHRKEIGFVLLLLLLSSALAIAFAFWPRSLAGVVSVSLHGQEVAAFRLDEDRTYELPTKDGIVVIAIKDGKAGIVSSPCPNQHCMKEGFKNEEGSSIVCVPEEVALYFLTDKEIAEVTL